MIESIRSREIREGVHLIAGDTENRRRAERDRYERTTLTRAGRAIYQGICPTWPLELIEREVARAVDA